MSPTEYSEFLANAKAVNSDPLNCGNYSAVAYRDSFAGYVYSDESEKNEVCSNMPRALCGGGAYNTFMNDLTGAGASGAEGLGQAGAYGPSAGKTPSTAPSGAGGIDYRYVAGAAVSIILLAAFLAFSIMMRRPEEEGVDEALVHRTLSSETRVGILNELQRGERTPTDLSSRLGKSKATVVEHLDRLISAQLVEKIENEGKKFVFYRLTPRGKAVLRRAG
jgi:DNA-binding transcriptional ArsR family regulator